MIIMRRSENMDGYMMGYDEPRFKLDMDSICYGCEYYNGEEEPCTTPEPCIQGSMNGYRLEG